jgi:hypothetical protein
MPTTATPVDFFKVPDSAETWTALGASTVKFNSITLSGYKSAGVANTGNIRFRPSNGSGYVTIEPENDYTVTAPSGTFYRASQFELYSETAADGLYAIYSSAVVYDGP